MPRDLDKTFYVIKWVSSVVALQDHTNFSMTVKQRKYDKNSECLAIFYGSSVLSLKWVTGFYSFQSPISWFYY